MKFISSLWSLLQKSDYDEIFAADEKMRVALIFPPIFFIFSQVFCSPDDEKCAKFFDVSNKTIIKTSESLKNGAKFLKSVANNGENPRRRCVKLCCRTENCNMLVLQEKKNGFCYLFDCGPINRPKCTFSDHENHVAMGLMVERREIFAEKSKNEGQSGKKSQNRRDFSLKIAAKNHEDDLQALKNDAESSILLTSSTLQPRQLVTKALQCTPTQWMCKNGEECIAVYDRCDGVSQCSDGSDESFNCVGLETNIFRKNYSKPKSAVDENGDTLPPLERPQLIVTATQIAAIAEIATISDFRLDYGTYGDDRSLAAVMFGLGLAVLVLLLIFLICRLKNMRRRLRRRGGDFGRRKLADLDEGEILINGMYL